MATVSANSHSVITLAVAPETTPLPSILRSSSSTAISDSLPSLTSDTSSTPSSTLSVSFAALPPTSRSKKSNITKLGVASRTSLLRQRPPYYNHAYGTNEDGNPQVNPYYTRKAALEEENEALEAIGQMISEAGRSLWRRVSRKRSKSSINNDVKVEVTTVTPVSDKMKGGPGKLRDKELHVDRVVQYSLKEEFEDGASDEDINSGLAIERNSPSLESISSEDAEASQITTMVDGRHFPRKPSKRVKPKVKTAG